MTRPATRRDLLVYADWQGLPGPQLLGTLAVTPGRGREIFSFAYAPAWLASPFAQVLDPTLQLYAGPQYQPEGQTNFGLFLDSAPDRWGRVLMERREAALARQQGRPARKLLEADYLLGVYDGQRLGGLRFREQAEGPFLDDDSTRAAPPWASLRELEYASLQLEQAGAVGQPDYLRWLAQLVVPGSSLGGARPKASVVDPDGNLWIAKFPSLHDGHDVGAWEAVVNELAGAAGLTVAEGRAQRFHSRHHTFLSRRFDRTAGQAERRHFASALTLLGYADGTSHQEGASYLELAEWLMARGAAPATDLPELWRRIAFNVCVSNTDDHLRNHGFLLTTGGWRLAPAYDLNPIPHGYGLKLNISATDNALDLDLVREVAPLFRLSAGQTRAILGQVVAAVRTWPAVADSYGIGCEEQQRLRPAFAVAEAAGLDLAP